MASTEHYEQIAGRLGELHKRVRRKQSEVLEAYNVSLLEYHIIVVMLRSEQISQSDIADVLDVNKALISRQLQSMEKKGLLYRDNDPNCRRKNLLSLSPKAMELLPKLKEAHQHSLTDIFSDLDDGQVQELSHILEGLVNKL